MRITDEDALRPVRGAGAATGESRDMSGVLARVFISRVLLISVGVGEDAPPPARAHRLSLVAMVSAPPSRASVLTCSACCSSSASTHALSPACTR